ncbi:hsp70-Hsp90 organizing protein 1 [Ricinus communis]|uniref:Heat shock protein 70 (HSP70)-interacting protein, putative n=1 Tax=Ricinus communis TaxID=3988 RepID=B9RTL2_RICCO|nr:hsp70-Hsp90 organizing protein 1 [Ricinus communis]EEF45244.1 heat shock protein 70 (HSP70)-interacting protein, putative [Ricinus communis]|eukprot:XP_002517081.1 hsp70-Hsp90 organizing protein 1 [Ricinus communis]
MAGSATAASTDGNGGEEVSLKDKGNEFFKAGNYLKAAALYTQAIKLDPSNPTLYSNRAAAFLQLVKLNKALADAEMTITLNPQWEKGYFRKGCVLEAMERYDDASAAFQTALKYNPQSSEVSRKIKRISQLAKEKKRAQEVESMRSNVDLAKHFDKLKSEMSEKIGSEECLKEIFSFLVETMEMAVKSWHETSKVDPRVYFLLDKEKTQSDKYAPAVNIDKAFESPHTHSSCFTFLRQYAEESFSKAACLVAPKSIISYPQVWKGQGSRKWKHGQHDGFFVQFESPCLRKLWFISSTNEKGQTLCRDPEMLDISAHEVFPRLFKEKLPNS